MMEHQKLRPVPYISRGLPVIAGSTLLHSNTAWWDRHGVKQNSCSALCFPMCCYSKYCMNKHLSAAPRRTVYRGRLGSIRPPFWLCRHRHGCTRRTREECESLSESLWSGTRAAFHPWHSVVQGNYIKPTLQLSSQQLIFAKFCKDKLPCVWLQESEEKCRVKNMLHYDQTKLVYIAIHEYICYIIIF